MELRRELLKERLELLRHLNSLLVILVERAETRRRRDRGFRKFQDDPC